MIHIHWRRPRKAVAVKRKVNDKMRLVGETTAIEKPKEAGSYGMVDKSGEGFILDLGFWDFDSCVCQFTFMIHVLGVPGVHMHHHADWCL